MKNKIVFLLLCFLLFSISCKKNEKKLPEYLFVSSFKGSVLRSNPGVDSKAIITLPYMTKVNVLKQDGDKIFLAERYGKWINVKSDKNEGWIFSGFLCEFQTDTLIKLVADYYRSKYSQDVNMVKYDGYTKFKNSEVSIINIIDNYITLEIPTTDRTSLPDIVKGNVIWKYDSITNQFSEIYNAGHGNTTTLLYLNDDNYPDIIVDDGCCSSPDVHIFLGSEKGFNNVYEMNGDCDSDEYYSLKSGHCENTTFTCSKRSNNTVTVRVKTTDVTIDEETEYLRHFKFDCAKSKIELFGEGLITRASGIITALDIKNKTISIKDDEDKNRSFSISEDVFVSGKTAKTLTDLKTGEDISLAYETLNGKDITLRIDSQEGWSPSGFGQNGLVLAVDFNSKKMALVNSGRNHIYELADNVVFENTGNRTIDQLEINEDVKIYFDKGKVNRITTAGIVLNGSVSSIDHEKRIITIRTEDGNTMNLEIATFATIRIHNKTSAISEIQESKKISAHYVNISDKLKLITSIQVSK